MALTTGGLMTPAWAVASHQEANQINSDLVSTEKLCISSPKTEVNYATTVNQTTSDPH